MNSIVTGAMCSLCVVFALIKPPTLVRHDVKEFVFAPDVCYRVERFWRMPLEANIKRQAEHTLAESNSGLFISYPVSVDRWWITRKFHNAQQDISDWFADRRLLAKLKDLYRADQRNWILDDFGITRNDKPIDIPEALKNSIWQHQALQEQQRRQLDELFYSPSYLSDLSTGSYKSGRDVLSQWLENQTVENQVTDSGYYAAEVANDTFGTETEAIYIYPYVLLIRDGELVGVLGGSGEFDFIPHNWKQFCRDSQINIGNLYFRKLHSNK